MPTWEEVRDSKKAAKQAAYAKYNVDITGLIPETRKNVIGVPAECGKLTKEELEITETKASELLAKLASGTLSAVAVTTAFGKRALIADQVVNCLTEVFLDHALADAAELDACLKTNGKPKGPLHGLPISLKDQFSIKGIDTCMGYSAWANKPAERDSSLVVALKQAGAVLYVRTNVPQSLMVHYASSDSDLGPR
jgi:amidase